MTTSWACGGVPNSLLKKAASLAFGLPSVMLNATTLPRRLRTIGFLVVPCCTSKPVTWPTAWQLSGQLTAGGVAVWPRSIGGSAAAIPATTRATAPITVTIATSFFMDQGIEHDRMADGALIRLPQLVPCAELAQRSDADK